MVNAGSIAEPKRQFDEHAPAAREERPAASGRTTRALGEARRHAWIAAGILLAIVVAGGVFSYRRLMTGNRVPNGLVQVNGRIEGDSVLVSSKQPGRIESLSIREGDAVVAGQTLARLEDASARARVKQAEAARDVARARVAAARAGLAVMRREVPIGIGAARAKLRSAEAALVSARASEAQVERERNRVFRLRQSQAVDEETKERADLALATAAQRVAAAEATEHEAEQAVADARLGPDRVRAKEADLAALDATLRQADALVDEARTVLDDLAIVSPTAGTVTVRFREPGEVIGAGTPLFEIVDLDHLYLRGFVAESDIGKVRLGLAARIYTDAFPGRAIPAELRYIASRAEFTPKEVQTRDERTKLVYAVKLYVIDNRDRSLSPGLSADAIIRFQEDAPWTPPF